MYLYQSSFNVSSALVILIVIHQISVYHCRRPYGAAKQVDIHSLLSLIQRGLAVNYAVLEKNLTTDNIAIKAVISEIHSKLIDIVICLIHM